MQAETQRVRKKKDRSYHSYVATTTSSTPSREVRLLVRCPTRFCSFGTCQGHTTSRGAQGQHRHRGTSRSRAVLIAMFETQEVWVTSPVTQERLSSWKCLTTPKSSTSRLEHRNHAFSVASPCTSCMYKTTLAWGLNQIWSGTDSESGRRSPSNLVATWC